VNRLVRVGYGPYDLTGCDKGALLKVDAKKLLLALQRPNAATAPTGTGEFSDGVDDPAAESSEGEWGVLGVEHSRSSSSSNSGEPTPASVAADLRRRRAPLTRAAFNAAAKRAEGRAAGPRPLQRQFPK
jgi:hypothetical protein